MTPTDARVDPAAHNRSDFQSAKTHLKSWTKAITSYLRSDEEHPLIQPVGRYVDRKESWDADDLARINSLRIPKVPWTSTRNNIPDMLLYKLGSLETLDAGFAPRIQKFLDLDADCAVVNASGTGKSRLLFEALGRRWGLYFTCYAHDTVSPYGSLDLTHTFADLWREQGLRSEIDLRCRGPSARQAVETNRSIIRTTFLRVLLARVMVFGVFSELVASLGIALDVARRRWLMIQLRPDEILKRDVFSSLLIYLADMGEDELLSRTKALLHETPIKLELIALDEAQVAAHTLTRAFATTDMTAHAPILRELVVSFLSCFREQRLLVAGTDVPLSILDDAQRHFDSPRAAFSLFHELGQFDSLAQLVLQTGSGHAVDVVSTLLLRLTSFWRSRGLLYHQNLMGYNLMVEDNTLDKSPLALPLRRALFQFAFSKQPSYLQDQPAAVVALGLGMFRDTEELQAEVSEPLVFYKLAAWLQASTTWNFAGLLARRRADPKFSVRRAAFAEGLCPHFSAAFAAPGYALDSCFNFEGPQPPFWRTRRAKLVVRSSKSSRVKIRDAPSDAGIVRATGAQDVFSWLSEPAQPFLVTEEDLGAGLLFFLNIEGVGVVLVCVECDPFPNPRPRRRTEVVPHDPNWFFPHLKQAPADRKTLLSMLKDLPGIPMDPPRRAVKKQAPINTYRYSTLHILCFARAWPSQTRYDPPVACLDFDALMSHKASPEMAFEYLDDAMTATSS
ncbi:hypothetical protein EXIGLDRAFT_748116 [Exidia glandulosa HHB12029]|uniref:Uncharacterized protein n=1 Tax=Exidia glandulosa HHB12029 TaxID=1314781 RepID=A0A165JZN7_EXIGL|nr:hypothetical protein EXIGLDRAFT_748116 [Exidia glandulosa HHB12029]